MSKFFPILFLACLSALAAPKKAAKSTPDTLAKIQEKYRSVPSFSADIQQEVYQAALARTKSSKGSLQLQKPAQVRWEIHEPDPNILVSNGNSVWYYTPPLDPKGKGQAIKRSASDLSKQPLYRILSGQISFAKEFNLKEENVVEGTRRLKLIPKKPLGDTEEVHLTTTQGHEITELFLKNKGGNTTRIRLQNTRLGDKLPPNLFDFKPPPGTDLVKE